MIDNDEVTEQRPRAIATEYVVSAPGTDAPEVHVGEAKVCRTEDRGTVHHTRQRIDTSNTGWPMVLGAFTMIGGGLPVLFPALGDRWFSLFDGNRSGVRGVMST
jgi:hypothetical protein